MTKPGRHILRLNTGDVPLYFWGLYVVSFPLYLFGSGGLQPSSGVLALCMFATLLMRHRRIDFSEFIMPMTILLIFVSWIACVDFVFFNIYHDPKFLLSASFYLYNFLVFTLGLTLYKIYGRRFLVMTARAAVFSMIPCVLLSPFVPRHYNSSSGYGRQVFLFQNPNDFGYFCVLLGTVALYGYRGGIFSRRLAYIMVAAFSAMSVLAVSRAAVGAMAFIIFLTYSWRTLIAGAVAVSALGAVYASDLTQLNNLAARMEQIGTGVNDTRQIGRMFDNPEYLLLGAGEGANLDRFGQQHEIHSMLPNVAFSYGLIGLLFFVCFVLSLLWPMRLSHIFGLAPLLVYNAAHNGIRFSLAWITLALICALAAEKTVQQPAESRSLSFMRTNTRHPLEGRT